MNECRSWKHLAGLAGVQRQVAAVDCLERLELRPRSRSLPGSGKGRASHLHAEARAAALLGGVKHARGMVPEQGLHVLVALQLRPHHPLQIQLHDARQLDLGRPRVMFLGRSTLCKR